MKDSHQFHCNVSQLGYYRAQACQDMSDVEYVFLHGFGGSSLFWEDTIHQLSLKNWCAVDLLGHGSSNQTCLTDVFQLYDALQIFLITHFKPQHKLVLVSHSLSGMLSLKLLTEKIEYFRSAALISTDDNINLHPKLSEFIINKQIDVEFIEAGFPQGLSSEQSRLILGGFEQLNVSCSDLENLLLLRDWQELYSPQIPCLLIAGEQDRVLSPRRTRKLSSKIDQSTFITIPEAGHYPFLEQPKVFCQAIRGFFQYES